MRRLRTPQHRAWMILLLSSSCFLYGVSPTPSSGFLLSFAWTLTACLWLTSIVLLWNYYTLAWRNRPPRLMQFSVLLQLNPTLLFMPPLVKVENNESGTEVKVGPVHIVHSKITTTVRREYGQDRRRLTIVRRRDA